MPPKVVKVTPAQVAAARLKLVTSRELGYKPPSWVERVATADAGTRNGR